MPVGQRGNNDTKYIRGISPTLVGAKVTRREEDDGDEDIGT